MPSVRVQLALKHSRESSYNMNTEIAISKMQKTKPAKPNLTITIEALTHEGRGIGTHEGKKVFVVGALPGEVATVKVLRKFKGRLEGVAVDIDNPSVERISAPCPHFGNCGGCVMQHMSAPSQLQLKQKVMLEQLQHFGGLTPQRVLPPLAGPTFGYRRKARLGIKYVHKKNKLLMGFRELDGRFVNDGHSCAILHPLIADRLEQLRELIEGLSIPNKIPQLEVAVGDDTAAIIVRHLEPLTDDDKNKLMAFGQTTQIHIYCQPKGPTSVHRLWPSEGDERLTYSLSLFDIEYRFHPTDFTQINLDINQKMIAQALGLIQPQAHERVLDLFCGLGNITLPLAQHTKSVVGVEGSTEMVERGYENAKHNQIDNVEFHAANLNEPVSANWMNAQYDIVVLDPPRSGAAAIVDQIQTFDASRILYISCNPATLARDSGILVEQKGYELQAAGVMDMFPHTGHVEAMAYFTRKER